MRYDGIHITEFHISTLDSPEQFTPTKHWFDEERIGWFEVADDLPRYSQLDYLHSEPTHIGPKSR